MGYYLQRRCPKCGGNMYLDKDYNGWYEQCLQCAFIHDLPAMYQAKRKEGAASPRRGDARKK
jgi:hypothetical protein